MTEFEKQAYAKMTSEDRVFLWMAKAHEFIEFEKILTENDARVLMRIKGLLETDLQKEPPNA